ncbi:MAG: aminoglycoside phosphotransferase family protein [Proteobacteria bacterium]|nr:aminoglycoside phosphotransferase family protein [Pseudomonadota bacterium]
MAGEVVPYDVLVAFCSDPTTCTIVPLGSGNINDTYLVRSKSHSFVLQRINKDVFPKPLRVIENFQKITNHLSCKSAGAGSPLQAAVPVLTLEKRLFYLDSKGDFWRGQSYLPHESYKVLADPKQAFRVGKTLATFHRLVSDLDVQGFLDPLPGFHNLPGYLEDYDRVMLDIKIAADVDVHSCMATIDRYRQQAATLEHAKFAGILTLQPIHGDPKVDNFLFGDQGEVLGLLDLDTVAMGLVHYDLGDCLRSCCNRVGEAGGTIQPVKFDMVFCQALLDGYFVEPGKLLSKEQRNYIFDGVLLICFELGVRFFTDHLRGNPYFKVRQDGENLLRAVNQFRLVDDIAKREREIRTMSITSGVE